MSNIINESKYFLDKEEKNRKIVSSLKQKFNKLEKDLCNIRESKAPKKTKKVLITECKVNSFNQSLSNLEASYEKQISYCENMRDEGIRRAEQVRDEAIRRAEEQFNKSRNYFEDNYKQMVSSRETDYEEKKNKLAIKKQVVDTELTTIDCDKSAQEISLEKDINIVKNEIKSMVNILESERKKLGNKLVAYLIETNQYMDYIKHFNLQSLYEEEEKEETIVPTIVPKLLPITPEENKMDIDICFMEGEDFTGMPPERIQRLKEIMEEEKNYKAPKKIMNDEDLCNIDKSSFTQNDWDEVERMNEYQKKKYTFKEETKEEYLARLKRQREKEAEAKRLEIELLTKKSEPPPAPKEKKKIKTVERRTPSEVKPGVSTYAIPLTSRIAGGFQPTSSQKKYDSDED